MGEVRLSAQAADVATRISSIDRRIADLDSTVTEFISQGLRYGGGLNTAQRAIDDEERRRLVDQRAGLVDQLKSLVAER